MSQVDYLEDFVGVAEEFSRLVGNTPLTFLDDPTPCGEWNIRQLMNHVVTGTQWFTTIIKGEPAPNRSIDVIRDDPDEAVYFAIDSFCMAISGEGVMDKEFDFRDTAVSGERLLRMRTNELLIHGWDLATATDQTAAFDDEVAERSLELCREQLEGRVREPGGNWGVEQPVPPGATAYQRLVAFSGRTLAS